MPSNLDIILVLSLCLLLSCTRSIPGPVQEALQLAGDNKTELIKVIDHYREKGETKKLLAAYYLIENMPGQYHYEGTFIDSCRVVFEKMDSLTRFNADYKSVWDSLQLEINKIQSKKRRKVLDINVIKSDFLISSIEEAFASWEYPWAKQLSFDHFCEYILPYKLKNEKPELWRKHFHKRYSGITKSLKDSTSLEEACIRINEDLKPKLCNRDWHS